MRRNRTPSGGLAVVGVAPVVGLLALAAACGGGGESTSDAGSEGGVAPGSGTLDGAEGFPVGSALLSFAVGGLCSRNGDAGAGVIPAIQIAMLQKGIAPSAVCPDAASSMAVSGSAVEIGIATPQWASFSGAPLTDSIGPGTYTISNEHVDDEDLCMLTGGGSAFLLISPLGGATQSIAASGTVTLDRVGADGVAGSFQVSMGGVTGNGDAGTLSGSFNALPACP